MPVALAAVSVDCEDALTVAQFWSAALGRPLDPRPSSDFASIGMPEHRDTTGWRLNSETTWLFSKVPEGKFREPRTDRSALTCGNEGDLQYGHGSV